MSKHEAKFQVGQIIHHKLFDYIGVNDEGKGQIGGANVVWDAGDHGNAGGTAQPACGFRGTLPSAIVYAVPEFIWGMSAYA